MLRTLLISFSRLSFIICCLFGFVYSLNNFTPKVEWKCLNDSLSIHLINNSPFFGVVHPLGQRNSDCVIIGTGGAVLDFELNFDKCKIHYDKKTKTRRLRLEVHEHKTLLMEQDQTVDIECTGEAPILTTKLPTSEEIDAELGNENMTESMENLPVPQQLVDFDLELLTSDSKSSVKIANYGQAYNLRVNVHEPLDRRFRIHSCYARSAKNKVELIDSHGCSLDKNLIGDFVYEENFASAKIGSLFRFPNSQSITFDCLLKLCAENDECKPNCVLKLDNPVGEDPELVSKLLRSSLPDDDIGSASGHMPIAFSSRKHIASTEVHVVERRETTLLPTVLPTESIESTTTDRNPINITGCGQIVPDDLVLMYKLCIALSLLFALGCACNVLFCCLNVRGKNATKKRRSVPKTIAQSTLTRNQYWISEPVREPNGSAFEEFPATAQYAEMQPAIPDNTQPKRNSLTSYASLRPRPKTSIDPPSVSLIGFHPNGQPSNQSGFQYDTNATSIMSALSNYNNNRNSPPRSSGYEVPNNRTFHSASNSVSTASPRNSLENTAINPAASNILNGMNTSTTSASTAQAFTETSPQFLTLSSNENPPAQTYSIL